MIYQILMYHLNALLFNQLSLVVTVQLLWSNAWCFLVYLYSLSSLRLILAFCQLNACQFSFLQPTGGKEKRKRNFPFLI